MTPEEFEEKLEELWIRFNTSPKLYQKEDYLTLYQILEELSNLHDTRIVELKNNWDEVVASNTLPNGILIKDTIRGIQEKLASIIISLEDVAKEETSQEILTAVENIDIDLTPVEDKIDSVSDKVDSIAADLDGVAQEATLTQGVQTILEAMPSTDGLATEENATDNKDEILAAIEAASMRTFSGHLDEIGLAQIGWGEDDIAWFRKRVDWDASMDDAMKVPHELIDEYNEYKDQHGGVVDSGFYTAHKGQWYFRYAPVISSYPWESLRDAPYMLACPKAYYQVRADYAFLGSGLLRYVPDLKLPSWNGPYSFADWMRGISNIYILNAETESVNMTNRAMLYTSSFFLLRIVAKQSNINLYYPPSRAMHLYLEGKSIKDLVGAIPDWLSGCLSCFIKGLAGSARMIQKYITKKELLFAINNEASDGTTPYVITLNAAMYNIYANDAEVLEALSNHSNFALAST